METLLIIPFVIALVVGIILLFSLILRWLWNMTMPDVFGLKALSFWQAFRVLLIAGILFQGGASYEVREIKSAVAEINEKMDVIIGK